MNPLIFLAPLAVDAFADIVSKRVTARMREEAENEKIDRMLQDIKNGTYTWNDDGKKDDEDDD